MFFADSPVVLQKLKVFVELMHPITKLKKCCKSEHFWSGGLYNKTILSTLQNKYPKHSAFSKTALYSKKPIFLDKFYILLIGIKLPVELNRK
jgi:hypothetical protein